MLFLWTFFLMTLCVYCTYWRWQRRRRAALEPPRLPGALPLIGHAHLLMGDSEHLFKVVKDLSYGSLKAGGAVTVAVGPRNLYILTDPDDCFIVANSCLQKAVYYDFAKPWLGEGLVTGILPVWKRHRKLLNPAFSQQVLDTFQQVFNVQARRLIEEFAPNVGQGPFDHWKYLGHNALETICLTALGVDDTENEVVNKQYVQATEQIYDTFVDRFQNVLLHVPFLFQLSNVKKKQDAALRILHHKSNTVLQRRKTSLHNKTSDNVDHNKGMKYKAFLDLLLELAQEKGVFTDQEIREEVDTMIVGGHDTSATTLLFVLVYLGSYADTQQKVFEELETVFGDSERDVEKQDLSQLVYLEAVIKETLRLIPIVPLVARHIDKDLKIKNHTLFAGSHCFFFFYGIHRHKLWGEDSEEFRPERWLDPTRIPDHPTVFSPFSMGRRMCIGKQYAFMSMKTTLAHLLRVYKVTADHNQLRLKQDIMLRPVSGHHIAIERRK